MAMHGGVRRQRTSGSRQRSVVQGNATARLFSGQQAAESSSPSSQSWNAIPEARRKALAGRLRQSRDDSSDEDVGLETIDEAIAKPYRSSSSDKDGKASTGSRRHGGGAKNKSPSNSFQEQDVDDDVVKDHDRKLKRLETQIEKLLTLNENLSERNQKLEDLLVQVAERVGISHGLGKRSSPARH